jgi:hypothetical protein
VLHIRRPRRGFRLREEKGAVDLASIMVGVIVLGIIGGIIAAAVFVVVPWAQDQAAKANLSSVVEAESVTMAQNQVYAGGPGLVSGKLLTTSNLASIAVGTDAAADCWAAVSASPTGAAFWADSSDPTAQPYTAGTSTSTCTDLGTLASGLPGQPLAAPVVEQAFAPDGNPADGELITPPVFDSSYPAETAGMQDEDVVPTLSGTTAPGATVNIFSGSLSSPTIQVTADASGDWSTASYDSANRWDNPLYNAVAANTPYGSVQVSATLDGQTSPLTPEAWFQMTGITPQVTISGGEMTIQTTYPGEHMDLRDEQTGVTVSEIVGSGDTYASTIAVPAGFLASGDNTLDAQETIGSGDTEQFGPVTSTDYEN